MFCQTHLTVSLIGWRICYITFALQVNAAHLLKQHSRHCPFYLLQCLIIPSVQSGEDQNKEDVFDKPVLAEQVAVK